MADLKDRDFLHEEKDRLGALNQPARDCRAADEVS
jgi:hypothetical protein